MGEDWSDKELEICVLQYWKACKNGGQSHAIDRSAFIKAALRADASLRSRGEGSVQRRMCNLSAIMEMHGKPFVIGWKPLPNVGANMTPKIEAMMRERGLL
jgi:hypothetical protein